MHKTALCLVASAFTFLGTASVCRSQTAEIKFKNQAVLLEIDRRTGGFALTDLRSGVRWPTNGFAGPAVWSGPVEVTTEKDGAHLRFPEGTARITLSPGKGRCVITYQAQGTISAVPDLLVLSDKERGYAVVPSREGLLIPASGPPFRRTFGTSDYEGCHMNVIGVSKQRSALLVTWSDAYTFPELCRKKAAGGSSTLTCSFTLRRTARSLVFHLLGPGDWNLMAERYRAFAAEKGLAVTLREKIRRNRNLRLLLGAPNVKLWTCLVRRMNEESTREEFVRVRWSFDEAASIAEHLHDKVGLKRCLFILGGWTEGGYDCRHPDNLPANSECGGNRGLAQAVDRIQALGFVGCLHDNYQDMYRNARSWNPAYIQKRPDGSLARGGRWLGGRAYLVCAIKQLALASRPQNLPEIRRRFPVRAYFIDTTFAVGPQECYDPAHPLDRNGDIAWKIRLSDYARKLFGLFGSECGREWALPHSDFFEGLVGVAGRAFHNLKPEKLGALVIPFFEMVYHDCQICYGKYGYAINRAAPYVAHHVLCARPLHYHTVPDHLYWFDWKPGQDKPGAEQGSPSAGALDRYLRAESKYMRSLHPFDRFLRLTNEVLGPLHRQTAFDRLTEFKFLTEDRSVRQAVYGKGDGRTWITVNFGKREAVVRTPDGRKAVLPPWGFVVVGPRFAAFNVVSLGGTRYPSGVLFTVRSVTGAPLSRAEQVRIFRGFGPEKITWGGGTYRVEFEKIVKTRTSGQTTSSGKAKSTRQKEQVR